MMMASDQKRVVENCGRNTDYMVGAFHCLGAMYDEESFCDLELHIVSHSVKVHRMIMAAFSPILAQRLAKAPIAHDGFFHVHLDDLGLKPTALKALVTFLYHGPKSPMTCDAASVAECAHTLQVMIVVNYLTDLLACNYVEENRMSIENSEENTILSTICDMKDDIHDDSEEEEVHDEETINSESKGFDVCELDSKNEPVSTMQNGEESDNGMQTTKKSRTEQVLDDIITSLAEKGKQIKYKYCQDESSSNEPVASESEWKENPLESSEESKADHVEPKPSRKKAKVARKGSESDPLKPKKRRRSKLKRSQKKNKEGIPDSNRTVGDEDENSKHRYAHFTELLEKARVELSKDGNASGRSVEHGDELLCPHCPNHFEEIQDLIVHIVRERHPHLEMLPYPHIIEDPGGMKWGCEVCPREFKFFGHYHRHFDWHKGSYHTIRNSGRKINKKCRYCEKMFERACELRSHEATHTGEKFIQCSYCGKTFRHQSSFRLHQRLHTGVKPFQCDKCDAAYVSVHGLKNHVVRQHIGKNFICDICGQAYFYPWLLKDHVRAKHTKERPFACECTATFPSKPGLLKHKRRSCKLRAVKEKQVSTIPVSTTQTNATDVTSHFTPQNLSMESGAHHFQPNDSM